MTADLATRRPRIAVTHDEGYRIDAYLQAIEMAGGDPVPVRAGSDLSMDSFDALLLSGGVDVDPALYRQEAHPKTEAPDPDRDLLERTLLAEALRQNKPILGVCRGLQLFNVAHGGTLHQHVEGHEREEQTPKSSPAHPIRINAGCHLARLLGQEDAPVNSRHHQVVDRLGEGLIVSATAPDGTVEALERADRRFAVAVQWHPEDMAPVDSRQFRLFEEFIAAARAAAC